MSQQITLTTFPAPARWTSQGRRTTLSPAEIVELLEKPELWPASVSVNESAGLLPGWSMATFADDARVTGQDELIAAAESQARVKLVHGLAVDYLDEPSVDEDHVREWWRGTWFVAYTTAFHGVPQGSRPAGPRWRVVMPLARSVDLDEAKLLAAWARHPRREAGMVAETTEEAGRVFPVPAIGPGSYAWTRGPGTLLDPDAAIHQLEGWQREDVERAARGELAGCLLDEALDAFVEARADGARPARFDWSGVQSEAQPLDASLTPSSQPLTLASLAAIGPLWPGRLALLMGTPGSGRTAFALQMAAAVASSGQPVLYVSLEVGVAELVARLLALRSDAPLAYRDVLLAAHDEADLRAACDSLQRNLRSLHLWAPSHAEKQGEALVERVSSLRRAFHGVPPLVILDSVDDWEGSDAIHPAGEIFGALRDVARPGCLGPSWPGAAVLAVAGAGAALAASLARPSVLTDGWTEEVEGASGLGASREAGLLLGLTSREVSRDAHQSERRAILVAMKNRHGRSQVIPLRFDSRRGRFYDED